MTFTHKTLLAIAFGLLLPTAQAADGVAATVNGKPIKQSLMDFIIKDANTRGQKVDDNTRAVVLNKLISSELVLQEAQKQGLDKKPEYQAREELLRRELLVNTYIESYIKKNPVDEAATKAEYEKFKKQLGDKEYNARHILVASEAEAKDIIAQLAKEKTKDTGSKDKGGDLGWFPPTSMVKPFSDAVPRLQKGLYTTVPVQTQFGWHVIKLEDTRPLQVPAYDKIKSDLQKQVQQRKLEKMLSDLREKAKVVTN